MREVRRRRLTLFDMMVLVAAAGLGVAMARAFRQAQRVAYPDVGWGPSWLEEAYQILAAATLAALFLRLLQPRPTLRRLARHPGFLGVLVASLSAVLCTLEHLPTLIRPRPARPKLGHDLDIFNYLSMVADPPTVGGVVALVWMIGLLRGFRWRRPDWFEWLGRTLGAVWVGSWLIMLVLDFFG